VKRKVIQIADSTQLVSLPRKWAIAHGVKKGDELDVQEEGDKITVRTSSLPQKEVREIDISDLEPMVLRTIVALYKKGIDEIKISFNNPELISSVQKVIGKEAVGFEITDQGEKYCTIKNVSGELEDFDAVLKRTFILLISMSERVYEAVKSGSFDQLKNIAFLEEANNRFTTSCRRNLNKSGYKNHKVVGPIYYIVEELENIADQYKYMCLHLYSFQDKKIKIKKELLSAFSRVDDLLKKYYDLFYNFDNKRVASIGKERKIIVDDLLKIMTKTKDSNEFLIIHYLMTIMHKTFCLVGPLQVMVL